MQGYIYQRKISGMKTIVVTSWHAFPEGAETGTPSICGKMQFNVPNKSGTKPRVETTLWPDCLICRGCQLRLKRMGMGDG